MKITRGIIGALAKKVRDEQTGNELDNYYRCSKCNCHNESCRCPDESVFNQED